MMRINKVFIFLSLFLISVNGSETATITGTTTATETATETATVTATATITATSTSTSTATETTTETTETEQIFQMPLLLKATPEFVKQSSSDVNLILGFDEILMNKATEVMIRFRGGGLWDEETLCINVGKSSVSCPLPLFPMTGRVTMLAQFNSTSPSASPFLPINHTLWIWNLKVKGVTPTEISRNTLPQQISIGASGIFLTEKKTNLIVELRGPSTIQFTTEKIQSRALSIQLSLPKTLDNGVYEIWISVDSGINFFPAESSVTIYEPSFNGAKLRLEPSGGDISGGTVLNIYGVFGMMITKELKVRFRLFQYNNDSSVKLVHEAIVPATTNDILEPVVRLATSPVITLTTPSVPVVGYYQLSFSERNNSGFTNIPKLQFLYYNLSIAAIAPFASSVVNSIDEVNFYANEFPDTGIFIARFGHPLINVAGNPIINYFDVNCNQKIDSEYLPSILKINYQETKNDKFYSVSCKLPEMGLTHQKGTELTVSISVNGKDFTSNLPTNEIIFFDSKVSDMNPKNGAMPGGETVTIYGRGFQNIWGTHVQFKSKTYPDIIVYSPVRFVGEGILEFSVPSISFPISQANRQIVSAALIIGGNPESPVSLPDYTYDTSLPLLSSVEVDSGNSFSEFFSTKKNRITIRVTAIESLESLNVQSFSIGPISRTPNVTAINPERSIWTITYVVQPSDLGELKFTFVTQNKVGNYLPITDESPIVEKKITVDSKPPAIELLKIESSNLQNSTEAYPSDEIKLLVKFDKVLKSLVSNYFSIGSLNPKLDVSIETIGKYPSNSWKLTCKLPNLIVEKSQVVFELTAQDEFGNKKTVTESDANGFVTVFPEKLKIAIPEETTSETSSTNGVVSGGKIIRKVRIAKRKKLAVAVNALLADHSFSLAENNTTVNLKNSTEDSRNNTIGDDDYEYEEIEEIIPNQNSINGTTIISNHINDNLNDSSKIRVNSNATTPQLNENFMVISIPEPKRVPN
eukprot:c19896_g1_i1.p1 GENE.c19896_g1_i1~~c19896_g1_i1.p1  ORF type:complete len:981 (-),score=424.54 c19896_g1_i1:21-2963(-)